MKGFKPIYRLNDAFVKVRARSDAKEQSAPGDLFTPSPTGRVPVLGAPQAVNCLATFISPFGTRIPFAHTSTRRNAQTPTRQLRSRRFHTREIQLRFLGNGVRGRRLLLKIETTEHVVRGTIAIG